MNQQPARFAFTGLDGHLYLLEWPGLGVQRLSWSDDEFSLPVPVASPLPQPQWTFSQPAWSPDRSRIASIGLLTRLPDELNDVDEEVVEDLSEAEEDDGYLSQGRIFVHHVDGVRSWEPAHFEDRPVFLSWLPSGEGLAALVEEETALDLFLIDLDKGGHIRPAARGMPLFYGWLSEERILLRTGEDSRVDPDASLVLQVPDEPEHIIGRAGAFAAPVIHPDRSRAALAIANGPKDSTLVIFDANTRQARPLLDYSGWGAFQWSGDGSALAVASGKQNEDEAFHSLEIWCALRGRSGPVMEQSILAFFWRHDGQRLVVVSFDEEGHQLWLSILDRNGREARTPQAIRPTQEQLSVYQFFDQFVESYCPFSPDGRHLFFAGIPAGDPDEGKLVPGIYALPLDEDGPMVRLADGLIGSFPLPR